MNASSTISFRVVRDMMLFNGRTRWEKSFHKCREETDVSMASSNPTKTCVNSESYPTTSSPFPFPRQDGFTQPYLGCLSIRRLYMIWMKKNQSKSTIQWNVVWVEPYTVKRLHCNPENLCICHLQWRDTSLMGAFSVVMRVSHE